MFVLQSSRYTWTFDGIIVLSVIFAVGVFKIISLRFIKNKKLDTGSERLTTISKVLEGEKCESLQQIPQSATAAEKILETSWWLPVGTDQFQISFDRGTHQDIVFKIDCNPLFKRKVKVHKDVEIAEFPFVEGESLREVEQFRLQHENWGRILQLNDVKNTKYPNELILKRRIDRIVQLSTSIQRLPIRSTSASLEVSSFLAVQRDLKKEKLKRLTSRVAPKQKPVLLPPRNTHLSSSIEQQALLTKPKAPESPTIRPETDSKDKLIEVLPLSKARTETPIVKCELESSVETQNELSRYKKMLKMGVPIGAIHQKMVLEGCSSTMIAEICGDLSSSTNKREIVTPPPTGVLQVTVNTNQPVATSSAMNALFEQVKSTSKSNQTSKSTIPTVEKTTLGSKSSKAKSLLDTKRALNAGIALSRVKNVPTDAIIGCLQELKPVYRVASTSYTLCESQLTVLQEQLIPSDAESTMLKSWKPSETFPKLADVDQFLLNVCALTHMNERIHALLWRLSVQSRLQEIEGNLQSMNKAVQFFASITPLHQILAACIHISITLSKGPADTNTSVRSLDSDLERLTTMKMVDDPERRLLIAVVVNTMVNHSTDVDKEICEKVFNRSKHDQSEDFETAKKIDMESTDLEIKDISNGLTKFAKLIPSGELQLERPIIPPGELSNDTSATEFQHSIKPMVASTMLQVSDAKQKYREMIASMMPSSSSKSTTTTLPSPRKLFKLLQTFLEIFDKAYSQCKH
jgi:Formin Homology 2 Domain/Subunit CCDC53 of WASH complex